MEVKKLQASGDALVRVRHKELFDGWSRQLLTQEKLDWIWQLRGLDPSENLLSAAFGGSSLGLDPIVRREFSLSEAVRLGVDSGASGAWVKRKEMEQVYQHPSAKKDKGGTSRLGRDVGLVLSTSDAGFQSRFPVAWTTTDAGFLWHGPRRCIRHWSDCCSLNHSATSASGLAVKAPA